MKHGTFQGMNIMFTLAMIASVPKKANVFGGRFLCTVKN